MKNEPFGLYTLAMAKSDSARALQSYRSRQCTIVAANFNQRFGDKAQIIISALAAVMPLAAVIHFI